VGKRADLISIAISGRGGANRRSSISTVAEGMMWGCVSLSVLLVTGLMLLSAASTSITPLDATAIIQRSVEANDKDWDAVPYYNCFERDRQGETTRTSEVLIILGSPYYRLVKENGKEISPEDQENEKRKLDQTIAQRCSESASEAARRIAKYQAGLKQDHFLMDQMVSAFDFSFQDEEKVGDYEAYVFKAVPRRGYQPPNLEAEALRGMAGRLWIEKNTFHWLKVEARVIRPVSIAGILAQVEPGTHFELENMPVAPGVWLMKHFSMASRSRILFLLPHRTQADQTYFGYTKADDERKYCGRGVISRRLHDLSKRNGRLEPSEEELEAGR